MDNLRHISQDGHEPAADGLYYAYARDAFGHPIPVVKPPERWGVWSTVRPTQDTDPADCRWCWDENFGCEPCPYHGERDPTEDRL